MNEDFHSEDEMLKKSRLDQKRLKEEWWDQEEGAISWVTSARVAAAFVMARRNITIVDHFDMLITLHYLWRHVSLIRHFKDFRTEQFAIINLSWPRSFLFRRLFIPYFTSATNAVFAFWTDPERITTLIMLYNNTTIFSDILNFVTASAVCWSLRRVVCLEYNDSNALILWNSCSPCIPQLRVPEV